MRDMKKLARQGWWKAMINQGTLSLILTLDDFLISGPHLCTTVSELSMSDPNVFVVKNRSRNVSGERVSEPRIEISTYYILRPHVRGILYGLNPFYQISLYVPCKNETKIELYQEIISKIDIGGQFFQDRIYWNVGSLQQDIMDSRLACLIYSGNFLLENDWLRTIAIESKPFYATIDTDFTMCDNLFDLVEMRSFLEDVHQRYFSLLNESNRLDFAGIIRLYVNEKSNKRTTQSGMANTNGVFSSENDTKVLKRFNSEGSSLRSKPKKEPKNGFFKTVNDSLFTRRTEDVEFLLEEYENIIREQLKINHEINEASPLKSTFAKTICRWNTITQNKSDVLKVLMKHENKEHIQKRLQNLNSVYCMKKFQSENDLVVTEQSMKSSNSSTSDNNYDLIRSNKLDSGQEILPFTIWYNKEIKL